MAILGRVMPWAVSPPQKQLILTLARGKYVGFNDSHLTEKLCAEEGLALSPESVRRILRAAKLASPQTRRPRQYRSRCPPRPRFGMMAEPVRAESLATFVTGRSCWFSCVSDCALKRSRTSHSQISIGGADV